MIARPDRALVTNRKEGLREDDGTAERAHIAWMGYDSRALRRQVSKDFAMGGSRRNLHNGFDSAMAASMIGPRRRGRDQ